jgi:hypothetical protein
MVELAHQTIPRGNFKYSGAPTVPFTAVEYGAESYDHTEGVTDEIPLQLRIPEW